MTLRVLIPGHFLKELQPDAQALAVELVAYDRQGRGLADTAGARALFRWWLTPEQGDAMIEQHPQLEWIHTGSAGVDHILTPAFLRTAITLTNSAGVHAVSIAEGSTAALLAVSKGIFPLLDQQRRHEWKTVERDEMAGKRIVMLGAGHIATAIADRLRPFGVHLVAIRRTKQAHPSFDETRTIAELGQAAATADWLIITAPLTSETRGLIGREILGRLPPYAWIMNVARGEIVDEAALIETLRERKVGGAVLDVFKEEPLPADHPFWDMDNVLVLPHTTWRSPQVKRRQLALFRENLRRFAAGETLLNVVGRKRGY